MVIVRIDEHDCDFRVRVPQFEGTTLYRQYRRCVWCKRPGISTTDYPTHYIDERPFWEYRWMTVEETIVFETTLLGLTSR